MPLVTAKPLNTDASNLRLIAKLVMNHRFVGYQFIGKKLFLYRPPTIGELLALEVAESHDPSAAAHYFLRKISLMEEMPRLRIPDVQRLVATIVEENFPQGEDGLADDLLATTHTKMTTLVGALGANLLDLMPDKNIEDMCYDEILDILARKQVFTQEPIMRGSMPAKKRRRMKHERSGSGNPPGTPTQHGRDGRTAHSAEESGDTVDAGARRS